MRVLSSEVQTYMNGEDPVLGTILLSLEIPSKYLDWFEPFQEYLFCLTHEVKNNSKYAAWYLRQSHGAHRTVVLNNSLSDLRETMSNEELASTALLVGADVIILPDHWDDIYTAVSAIDSFVQEFGTSFKTIGVIRGTTKQEMLEYYRRIAPLVTIVGFSKHSPRLELIRTLESLQLLGDHEAYALLGFKSFQELHQIAAIGDYTWLLNTGEPIKAAVQEREIVFGHEPMDFPAHIVGQHWNLTGRQLHAATLNVIKFRSYMPVKQQESSEDNDASE